MPPTPRSRSARAGCLCSQSAEHSVGLRGPRPLRHRYQALAAGHALQLAVHVLQVRRQCLLGLQGVFTLGFTLLQLDPAGAGEGRGEVSGRGPLDRPSPLARPHPRRRASAGDPLIFTALHQPRDVAAELSAAEAAGFQAHSTLNKPCPTT